VVPAADKICVDTILREVEDILDIATIGTGRTQDLLILIDRRGGIRMFDPTGWSFGGMDAEFGSKAIFKIERRDSAIRVEGRSGSERCLVERTLAPRSLRDLPGSPSVFRSTMPQVLALPAPCTSDGSPYIQDSYESGLRPHEAALCLPVRVAA